MSSLLCDDSQLYISFSPKAHSVQADAVASIEHCIQDIRQWMSQDKLLMNDAKTELLLIGTRQQLAKITIDGMMSLLHNLPFGICVCGWILAYQWVINNDLQHSIICTISGG